MTTFIYHVSITLPDGFTDDYMTKAGQVSNAMSEVLLDVDKIETLTKGATLQMFDTQLEITHESITAVIEYKSEQKVKLQKGVLKKLLEEKWPWPKLSFRLIQMP